MKYKWPVVLTLLMIMVFSTSAFCWVVEVEEYKGPTEHVSEIFPQNLYSSRDAVTIIDATELSGDFRIKSSVHVGSVEVIYHEVEDAIYASWNDSNVQLSFGNLWMEYVDLDDASGDVYLYFRW